MKLKHHCYRSLTGELFTPVEIKEICPVAYPIVGQDYVLITNLKRLSFVSKVILNKPKFYQLPLLWFFNSFGLSARITRWFLGKGTFLEKYFMWKYYFGVTALLEKKNAN